MCFVLKADRVGIEVGADGTVKRWDCGQGGWGMCGIGAVGMKSVPGWNSGNCGLRLEFEREKKPSQRADVILRTWGAAVLRPYMTVK
jgi:hypothetical protein